MLPAHLRRVFYSMNNEFLIQEFIKNAILHGQYTLSGEYRKANMVYGKIIELINQLIIIDPKYNFLEQLLDHPDDSVKIFSATEMLFTDKNNRAEKVLKRISKKMGLLAFNARMVLLEWKAGRLKPLHELIIDQNTN